MAKESSINKQDLVNKIKELITNQIYNSEKQLTINYSDYLKQNVNYNYTYMANIFSDLEKMSIQDFIIQTRITRAKELLTKDKLTLTEISYKLHYSNVSALSNQFKKVTGMNPTAFLNKWNQWNKDQEAIRLLNQYATVDGYHNENNINVN